MSKTTKAREEYCVLGVMSGSSLDGLDVCLTKFNLGEHWGFTILNAVTLELPTEIRGRLANADQLNAKELMLLDLAYGRWIGGQLKAWMGDLDHAPDLIGIHGHTVFHEPDKQLSIQIGSGSLISQITGIPVVDRFREKDVQLGGQGAPLVPFGEKHLFRDQNAFINLGGIANIAVHGEEITAWDIAPCNQVFNRFASALGHQFDEGGKLAQSGVVDLDWLNFLKSQKYFDQKPPKSLSNQWTNQLYNHLPGQATDALATYVAFLSDIIAQSINDLPFSSNILFTGGGSYNSFLIDQIQKKASSHQIIIPSREIIDYKEALIFGFLALQRTLHIPNVLASVTGATRDSVSGVLHLPE